MAYARLSYLFWSPARPLATRCEPLAQLPIRWSGSKTTRRDYEPIRGVALGISRDELDRRIKAFNDRCRVTPAIHQQIAYPSGITTSAEGANAAL